MSQRISMTTLSVPNDSAVHPSGKEHAKQISIATVHRHCSVIRESGNFRWRRCESSGGSTDDDCNSSDSFSSDIAIGSESTDSSNCEISVALDSIRTDERGVGRFGGNVAVGSIGIAINCNPNVAYMTRRCTHNDINVDGRIALRNCPKVNELNDAISIFWGLPIDDMAEPILAAVEIAIRNGAYGRRYNLQSAQMSGVTKTQVESFVTIAPIKAIAIDARTNKLQAVWHRHVISRNAVVNAPTRSSEAEISMVPYKRKMVWSEIDMAASDSERIPNTTINEAQHMVPIVRPRGRYFSLKQMKSQAIKKRRLATTF